VLVDGVAGSQAVAGALVVCAGVVLVLKVNVLIQLALLLSEIEAALALAPVTGGASLLGILTSQRSAGLAINLLISEAMRVIGG
jgi:hypothetical protein